ncbi:cobalamin biosynthesis protein [Actibacterium pelagium]|uniref:Precorrin methylase n=1 Tax=Actibacterium pelagium TaxID=2029103 RepID=A0A917ENV4_9RHOB|nr:cobalamin biosynthesis protein [Actibacterium pelagium]GGE60770.1 precorrin methylase [Actibacterium pelagium]
MRTAGIGCRGAVTIASLQDALHKAGGNADRLATLPEKAALPAVQEFAHALGLPLIETPKDILATQTTLTQSPTIQSRFGIGSVAEAAALAASRPGARLTGPRVISADGLATAAIAEGPDT